MQNYFAAINHPRQKIDYSSWSYTLSNEFPLQAGGTECAPILIRAAMDFAYLDKKYRFNWTEDDTPYLRRLFCSIIMRWKNGEDITMQQLASHWKLVAKQKANKPSTAPSMVIQPEPTAQSIDRKDTKSATPVSPIKSNTRMAKIFASFDAANCNEKLTSQLLQLPLLDLLRMSMLTRILLSMSEGQSQIDYQSHINWLLENIDSWPNCILQQMPDLKTSYLTLVLHRTDLGMGLLCWTTKCCRAHCMLTLMDDLVQQQIQWKQSTMEEKQRFLALKISRTVCIKKDGIFTFEKIRNHCTRAWQAVYGVHSGRINSAVSPKKPPQEKTNTWRQAVKQLSHKQIEEIDQHIEKTLLPNPFAPKESKGTSMFFLHI